MGKQVFASLPPGEALKRMRSVQTMVVVGPTSSGKSTLIYALVNYCIVKYIMVGIGDKRQTTIIPCNFLFDERIEAEEHFAIKINSKQFDQGPIHLKILDGLAKLYAMNGCDANETVDSIDETFMRNIFEPSDSAYHLGKIEDQLSVDEFKSAVLKALSAIAEFEADFHSRVQAKKKESGKGRISKDEIRGDVMEELWNEISDGSRDEYSKWLNSIEGIIQKRLTELLNGHMDMGAILEYSTKTDDEFPYGGDVLQGLFDPFEPYSLMIEDFILASRPRKEMMEKAGENKPLRFCLRDSMGLNQTDMDEKSMKDALDIALNRSPDSILLLLSLEENKVVVSNCCKIIGEKLGKAKKLNVPVNLIFTKPDIVIGNIINKQERNTVELTQEDYNKHIENAISSVDKMVSSFAGELPVEHVGWLSIRYLEEEIDPIQKALRVNAPTYIDRFQGTGLYDKISSIIGESQTRALPKGMKKPVYITVKKPERAAIEIKIKNKSIEALLNGMQYTLTQDKTTVNGYTITDKKRIHGRSVVKYYEKLCIGLGYQTRAYVYGNFSINMKGMLNNVLIRNIARFSTLYEHDAVITLADNMAEGEIDHLISKLDASREITAAACHNINPAVFDGQASKVKLQELHTLIRHYFESSGYDYIVMDKVAFKLSYGNNVIKRHIEDIYTDPALTYDETIRKMQREFLSLFGTPKFAAIVAEEIGNAMTDLVNKMFIII